MKMMKSAKLPHKKQRNAGADNPYGLLNTLSIQAANDVSGDDNCAAFFPSSLKYVYSVVQKSGTIFPK